MEANLGWFPVAYALVEQEKSQTWEWFPTLLREAVGRDIDAKPWCIISDRHKVTSSSLVIFFFIIVLALFLFLVSYFVFWFVIHFEDWFIIFLHCFLAFILSCDRYTFECLL